MTSDHLARILITATTNPEDAPAARDGPSKYDSCWTWLFLQPLDIQHFAIQHRTFQSPIFSFYHLPYSLFPMSSRDLLALNHDPCSFPTVPLTPTIHQAVAATFWRHSTPWRDKLPHQTIPNDERLPTSETRRNSPAACTLIVQGTVTYL
jgi:hypothetical protein